MLLWSVLNHLVLGTVDHLFVAGLFVDVGEAHQHVLLVILCNRVVEVVVGGLVQLLGVAGAAPLGLLAPIEIGLMVLYGLVVSFEFASGLLYWAN